MTVKELLDYLSLAWPDDEIEIIDQELDVNPINQLEIIYEMPQEACVQGNLLTQEQAIQETVRIYL